MEWRLIKDSYHTGFMNMAIDEAIMIAHREGLVPPTIRFYQWSPPAVSLGYFQDLKKEINVDVRIIAATNKNLKHEIDKGKFREDLYHRLSVIIMEVVPLRDRKDDIPLLVNRFIDDICNAQGRPPVPITEDAMKELQNFNWSGNVRELHNVVERMIILCSNEITKEDVSLYVKPLML